MNASRSFAPSHLSVFVVDAKDGHPAHGVPIYAEIAVPRIVSPPRIPERLRTLLLDAIIEIDPNAEPATRDAIMDAAFHAAAEVLAPSALAALTVDFERLREILRAVVKRAMTDADVGRFSGLVEAGAIPYLEAAFRETAADMGIETSPESGGTNASIWAEPLGVLTTDHAGYLSFDLTRVQPATQLLLAQAIAAREVGYAAPAKVAIRLQPYGSDKVIDALDQSRFAFNAIVARVEFSGTAAPKSLLHMGPRALQKPSLTDWRLSPASFAASSHLLLGEDACEAMVPSNLALDEFVLRQIVRLTDEPEDFNLPDGLEAAYVDDYKVSWFSLGHSLGEVLYSLPLAPGETVKLAVIDWSREAVTKRDEDTSLSEKLLHQTHRDRTIAETVKAGLKEVQHGSSFMGGMANSIGGSLGANLGVLGVGAAAGNTWSFGGATATSEGSRNLTAENVQRLNDNFVQASSARREFNSTVVIQARQEEKETIQTRTFSNYNHSHTLTVLYYEVLRHYRVTVQWVRRRRAVLVKLPVTLPGTLTEKSLASLRYLLESSLKDSRLVSAFDAIDRLVLGEAKLQRAIDKWNATTTTDDPGAKIFVKLIAQFTTTDDDTSEPVFVDLVLHDGRRYEFQFNDAGNEGTSPEFEQNLPVGMMWRDIRGVEVKLKDINTGGDWEETNIIITMVTAANERVNIVADSATRTLDDSGDSTGLIAARSPPSPTTSTVGSKPQRADFVTADDDVAVQKLIAHVSKNRDYYNAVLTLGADPVTVATLFEKDGSWGSGQVMADHVDPAPLDVFGSDAAFALADQGVVGIDDSVVVDIAAALDGSDPERRKWAQNQLAAMSEGDLQSVLERLPLASARSERLITLPTRGVFAEGKLGHCNISEEVDNTRFWKWDEHPIPVAAPEIAATVPVQPQPQPIAATPTQFPQSLVNIVNPSPAPAPQGLSAALSLLGTPNIFRDMSGRQEVADLLKKLSDNSISIADAANRAREIQAKYGTDLDKQQKDFDLGVTKAAAETEGKAIEADAQVEAAKARVAAAQAKEAEAEAKKATVDAANKQVDAAKNVPKSYRAPIYADAATALSGNPTKTKVVVFKATGYDGQEMNGQFSIYLYELAKTPILNGVQSSAYGEKSVTFSTATPVVNARVTRDAFNLKIFDTDLSLPAIRVTNEGNSYEVGKSDRTIDLLLTQGSRDITFKAKTTDGAVKELMDKAGGELGIDKVVAAKLVAAYEEKHSISHTTEEEKSYSFNVPTQNYELVISSH